MIHGNVLAIWIGKGATLLERYTFYESFFDNEGDGYVNEDMPANEDWHPRIIKQRSNDSMRFYSCTLQNKREQVELLIHQPKA